MRSNLLALTNEKNYGKGRSKAAQERWEKRNKGLHRGSPGDVVKMLDRKYAVAKDGSFRRLPPAVADLPAKAA